MAIVPDTKDWTWVLTRACDECGFDSSSFAREELGVRLRAVAPIWARVLANPGAAERPAPEIWSPLEYACHVRDAFAVFEGRLARTLAEDEPVFDNWDQDVAAVTGRYGEQDPAEVTAGLAAQAEFFGAAFDAVTTPQWQRAARRSDGAEFTTETLGRYILHDAVHHLHDVGAA